jgi:hypothetical protein
MLAWPVWRYITIAGLSELSLASAMDAHASVELWPDLDRIDLRIRARGLEWEADVKDWTSATELAAHLRRRPDQNTWVVVPDYRRAQVPLLRERLPGRRVTTTGGFVREVRRAIDGVGR